MCIRDREKRDECQTENVECCWGQWVLLFHEVHSAQGPVLSASQL